MRHVTTFAHLPTRDDVAARIVDVGRFRPEPVLVKPVERRLNEDGSGEARVGKGGAWHPLPAAVMEIFAALEDGCGVEQIYARAFEKAPRKLPALFDHFVREYLWELHEAGHVHIPLEDPPAVFDGRYVRVRELGRGGMGVAHLCRDEEGGSVVIKHAWGWNRPIERAEYTNRREALVLADLDHPAFPKIRDTFEDRGILHIVRDFADGATLSGLRGELVRAAPTRRLRIGAALADALTHLHERGYLYLDAKPSNFVLLEGDRPLVLDLGVARPHDGEGSAVLQGRTGSPGYAAPEVRHGRRASVLSDQYGLGCVLFHLVMGSRPSRSWDEGGIARALAAQDADPRERAIIERMTAWDPAARYPSLAEAARAMREVA